MSRGQRAVCDWCYHMFLMGPNARLRLCPECKAEYQKRQQKSAYRKRKREQGIQAKPAYTIAEVLEKQREHREKTGEWLSYGEMVARLEKQE